MKAVALFSLLTVASAAPLLVPQQDRLAELRADAADLRAALPASWMAWLAEIPPQEAAATLAVAMTETSEEQALLRIQVVAPTIHRKSLQLQRMLQETVEGLSAEPRAFLERCLQIALTFKKEAELAGGMPSKNLVRATLVEANKVGAALSPAAEEELRATFATLVQFMEDPRVAKAVRKWLRKAGEALIA